MNSGLYVPMMCGQRMIGVISIKTEKLNAFSEENERLVATLANQAAVALENAQLYQTAQLEIDERKQIEALLAEEKNQANAARGGTHRRSQPHQSDPRLPCASRMNFLPV